jgi:hypothetical protein
MVASAWGWDGDGPHEAQTVVHLVRPCTFMMPPNVGRLFDGVDVVLYTACCLAD